MKIRAASSVVLGLFLMVGAAALGAWRLAPAALPPMRVVKSPSCGCCAAWVDYMKKQGFQVTVEDKLEFTDLKRSNGVTRDLESCHTAFVGGYVIEGHVPADLVKKLLTEKPKDIKGLAAPGMPNGSPGMEGSSKDHYTIYSFDAQGHAKPYATR